MEENKILKQFLVTPAAGKRIIARGILHFPAVLEALEKGTVVIVAGTTNGYVAEEILGKLNQADGFTRKNFFRGISLPPSHKTTETGRISDDESSFPGDVVIVRGKWDKGLKTIFDVADELRPGDVVIKGANALDLDKMRAGILIGHPKAGTIIAALQAVLGRRAELYLPVGLEKRVPGDLDEISHKLNSAGASGPRLLPVVGTVVTELQAIKQMTGVEAEVVSAGGVCGAEGSCWIAVSGAKEQVNAAQTVIDSAGQEPPFEM